jgi:hypothetical protein
MQTMSIIAGYADAGRVWNAPGGLPRRLEGALSAAEAVDAVLNLGGGPRDVAGGYAGLRPEDRPDFLKMLATLLRQGVIGTETRKVNGEPYTAFVDTAIADPRLKGIPLYTPPEADARRLDLRG